MAGIEVSHLDKVFKSGRKSFHALRDVSISVDCGEFVSLIGESGSGKSTLGKIVLGLTTATSGRVSVCGRDVSSLKKSRDSKAFRRDIQGVFQDSSGTLNPSLSVYSNVSESLTNLTDLSAAEKKETILELMELLKMEPSLLKTPTRSLSGGEQRRLSLLRALSVKPRFLVIDEVLSGLDQVTAEVVIEVLEEYNRHFCCGCLFITHDIGSAHRLSDKIYLLRDGEVLHRGTFK